MLSRASVRIHPKRWGRVPSQTVRIFALVSHFQKPDLPSGKGHLSGYQELECTDESCGHRPDTGLKESVLEEERAFGEDGWVCILEPGTVAPDHRRASKRGFGCLQELWREGTFLNQGP